MAHVASLNFEHEIVLAGDVVDLGDLGNFLDRLAESLNRLGLVEGEGDVDEGDELTAKTFGVENGDVALDDAAFLEDTDPLEDAGGAEADGFGKVGVGDSSVALEDIENLYVRFVKLGLHFFCGHLGEVYQE